MPLGEPAERVRVDVEPAPGDQRLVQPPPRRDLRHPRAPVRCRSGGRRQSTGSRWSSRSSTVTAPSRCSSSSTTGRRHQVVGGEVAGDARPAASSGGNVARSVSTTPADQSRTAPRGAAAGCARSRGSGRSGWPTAAGRRRPWLASAGGMSGLRMRASASATVASGRSTTGSRGHQAARGVVGVLQQPPHRRGLVGLHQREQPVGVAAGSSRSRSAASSGSIASSTSAARSAPTCASSARLVGLGQLLEDVGEPLVVERVGHLVAPFLRQLGQRVRRRRRAAASPARRAALPCPAGR